MGNLSLTYIPPQNWQDFEKLIKGVVDVIWKQYGWEIYGRPGQSQSGIDIFGYDNNRKFTGIQCKKKGITDDDGKLYSKSLLTESVINKEIFNAENIKNPELERLIFATTSSTDTHLQDIIKSISHQRLQQNKFTVHVWFWDDIQVFIERHDELKYWYFQELLEDIHLYDKDVHFLLMLRQAFTRPAFNTEMRHEESGADFIHAVKNTMESITTGNLYNRRGDLIASSFNYQQLSTIELRTKLQLVYDKLVQIRKVFQLGVLEKKIKEHPTCIEFKDDRVSNELNLLRREALLMVNEILKTKKINLVESELLRQ